MLSMAIPYSNRVAIAEFPELALKSKPRVTPTEVWADFSNQAAPLKDYFECIQLISASKLRILFPSSALMEDCLGEGLTFRSHPLALTPISIKKWVSVQRLPYGIPLEEVKRALNPFGKIFHAKHEFMEGVATGTISVQMEVKTNIPSKVMIKGHSCLIFYNGQQRTCFICQAPDHMTMNCPRRKGQSTARDNHPESQPSTSQERDRHPPIHHQRSEELAITEHADLPVESCRTNEHEPGVDPQDQEAIPPDSHQQQESEELVPCPRTDPPADTNSQEQEAPTQDSHQEQESEELVTCPPTDPPVDSNSVPTDQDANASTEEAVHLPSAPDSALPTESEEPSDSQVPTSPQITPPTTGDDQPSTPLAESHAPEQLHVSTTYSAACVIPTVVMATDLLQFEQLAPPDEEALRKSPPKRRSSRAATSTTSSHTAKGVSSVLPPGGNDIPKRKSRRPKNAATAHRVPTKHPQSSNPPHNPIPPNPPPSTVTRHKLGKRPIAAVASAFNPTARKSTTPSLAGTGVTARITEKRKKPNTSHVENEPNVVIQNSYDFLATLGEEEERPFLTASGNFLPDSPVRDQPLRPRPDLPQDSCE